MRSAPAGQALSRFVLVVLLACACAAAGGAAPQPAPESTSSAGAASASGGPERFATPEQAADALVAAARNFDVPALARILGVDADDIVLTGDYTEDRQRAAEFAAQAQQGERVSTDAKNANRALLLVGKEDWPFPVPLLRNGSGWSFNTADGRKELTRRRIGNNELDAIAVCRGYVEAQYQYAYQPRRGYDANQYAQRIISTPGKQDGLAWKNSDGSWGGPVGQRIARAIEQGYSDGEPYHGYFFKILKGQGPHAPHGAADFVVNGAMIGGFGLAAAPAEYRQTGVMTFIVSQDGVVYQKDLGPDTADKFKEMTLYDPDKSWTPVPNP